MSQTIISGSKNFRFIPRTCLFVSPIFFGMLNFKGVELSTPAILPSLCHRSSFKLPGRRPKNCSIRPSLPKSSSHTLWGSVFGTPSKAFKKEVFGDPQTPPHKVWLEDQVTVPEHPVGTGSITHTLSKKTPRFTVWINGPQKIPARRQNQKKVNHFKVYILPNFRTLKLWILITSCWSWSYEKNRGWKNDCWSVPLDMIHLKKLWICIQDGPPLVVKWSHNPYKWPKINGYTYKWPPTNG